MDHLRQGPAADPHAQHGGAERGTGNEAPGALAEIQGVALGGGTQEISSWVIVDLVKRIEK